MLHLLWGTGIDDSPIGGGCRGMLSPIPGIEEHLERGLGLVKTVCPGDVMYSLSPSSETRKRMTWLDLFILTEKIVR